MREPPKEKLGPLTWLGREKPWKALVTLYLVSVSTVSFFLLCIGLQCFGSPSSKVATFKHTCSVRHALWHVQLQSRNFSAGVLRKVHLAAPAGKSQLFSTSVVYVVHFGSSGSKVATFNCSTQCTFWQLQGSWLDSACQFMSWDIDWESVWVSVWALHILVCKNNLDLMCVFMAFTGIVVFLSIGLQCSGPAKKVTGRALT